MADWRLRAVFGFLVFAIAATPFMEKELASAFLAVSAAIGLTTGGFLFFIRSRDLPKNERRAWRWFGAGIALAAMGIGLGAMTAKLTHGVRKFENLDRIMRSTLRRANVTLPRAVRCG